MSAPLPTTAHVEALLTQHLQRVDVTLSPTQIAALAEYIVLLFQWNRVYNLTAMVTPEAFIQQHILDSLMAGVYLRGDQILDVGSGAGLPGIPLAILYPEKQFTLLESRGKRARFLHRIQQRLKLENVTVVNQRVEAFQADAIFTTIVTRAFSSLAQMLQMTHGLCHPNGLFLAMKGKEPTAELLEIPPDFSVEIKQRLIIPDMNASRHIIGVVHKEKECGQNSRNC